MTLSIDRFTQDKLFENGGQGAFDRLVHIGEENLRVEYDQGRITGSDYAQAHTALLQICYQVAAQFLIQSDQTGSQTELIKAQKELAKAQAEQAKAQTELAKKQLEIAEEQLKQAKLQNLLVKQKIITEQAQTRDYVDKLYGPDDDLYNISSEVLSKPIFTVDGNPNQPIINRICQPLLRLLVYWVSRRNRLISLCGLLKGMQNLNGLNFLYLMYSILWSNLRL